MDIKKDPSSKTFRSAPSAQEQGDFLFPDYTILRQKITVVLWMSQYFVYLKKTNAQMM